VDGAGGGVAAVDIAGLVSWARAAATDLAAGRPATGLGQLTRPGRVN
jgi:hypothetical protein